MIETIESWDAWGFIVSLSSILSLIIGFFVLLQTIILKNRTNEIQQSIINKARVPEIFIKLDNVSKRLSKVKSLSVKQDIDECIAEIHVLAEKLVVKIAVEEKKSVEDLIDKADYYLGLHMSDSYKARANDVYIQLKKVLCSVDEYIKDERLK